MKSTGWSTSRRAFLSAGLTLAVAVAVIPLSVSVTEAQSADRPLVAVVDFDTQALHGNWRWGWPHHRLGNAAASDLAVELVKGGNVRVVERQQLDSVLAEQNLGDGGRVDASTAASIGKLLGAQLVIIGAVSEFGINEKGGRIPQVGKWKWGRGVGGKLVTGKATINARLVDTTTGEILGAYEGSGSHKFGKGSFAGASFGTNYDSATVTKVLAEAVANVAGQINGASGSWEVKTVRAGKIEGKIAQVSGGQIFLNVGSDAGTRVGDTFEVYRLGNVIKDPDTGEVLGATEELVGTIEIMEIKGGKLAIARAASGKGFATGDKIKLK